MADHTRPDTDLMRTFRIVLLVSGLVALITGILILAWPRDFAELLTAILAAYLVIAGLVYVALGVFSKTRRGWARLGHTLLGIVYAVAGAVIFTNLALATATLVFWVAIVVGIAWVVDGAVSLSTLGDAASRAWTIVYAVSSILAGVLVLVSPFWAIAVLWWMLGIALVVLGVVQIIRAIRVGRNAAHAPPAPA